MTDDGDLLLAGRRRGDDVRVRRIRLRPRRGAVPALAPTAGAPRARRPGGGAKVTAVVALLAGELGTRDAGARAAVGPPDRPAADPRGPGLGGQCGERRRRPGFARSTTPSSPARLPCCTRARPSRDDRRLAAEVHLSRATLARRFTELVGEPPLTYLTRWRMDLAARRLKDTTEPVEASPAGSATPPSTRSTAPSAAIAVSRPVATAARPEPLAPRGRRAPPAGLGVRVVKSRCGSREAPRLWDRELDRAVENPNLVANGDAALAAGPSVEGERAVEVARGCGGRHRRSARACRGPRWS